MKEYGLTADDALLLTSTSAMANYYEQCANDSGNPRSAANWIMGDLAYLLKNSGKDMESCPISSTHLAELIRTIDSGKISGRIAKTVFEEMGRSNEKPDAIINRLGLIQVSDEASLGAVVDKIIEANPKQLAEYRSGKTKVISYFVGQAMKETKGQANPQILNELLQKKLND